MAINISVKAYQVPNTVDEAILLLTYNQTIRQFRNLGCLELIPVSEFPAAPEQHATLRLNPGMLRNPFLGHRYLCSAVSKALPELCPAALQSLADRVLPSVRSMTVDDDIDDECDDGGGFYVEAEIEAVTEDVANYRLTVDDIYSNNEDDLDEAKLKLLEDEGLDGVYNGSCGVCFKKFFGDKDTEVVRRLPCLHVHHYDCVIKNHNSCPSC